MSLRTKLIAVFLLATLAPLGAMLWVTINLLETSLTYASTDELDSISNSLEATGREFYQRAKDSIQQDAAAGKLSPQRFARADRDLWPAQISTFHASGDRERYFLSGDTGDRLNYLVRQPNGDVWAYARKLGGPGMNRLQQQIASAREVVNRARVFNLRRGFVLTLLASAAAVFLASLGFLIWMAFQITRPMRELQQGLAELASGNFTVRLPNRSSCDESGQTVAAFNRTAAQLEENRDKLVHLTRVASWQLLARKMAHEVRNSLTPIRLIMEELGDRHDPAFLQQAAQIVSDEVATLERRVRAFGDFAAEPNAHPQPLDVNSLLAERVALHQPAHPEVTYDLALAPGQLQATADPDLLKGVLTNLLENAAQAAGQGGRVRGRTYVENDRAAIAIEDSGPGLSPLARENLFAPTISFKRGGMGLGLSIAQRGAMLSGGTLEHYEGELGGAAFRVLLPLATTDHG